MCASTFFSNVTTSRLIFWPRRGASSFADPPQRPENPYQPRLKVERPILTDPTNGSKNADNHLAPLTLDRLRKAAQGYQDVAILPALLRARGQFYELKSTNSCVALVAGNTANRVFSDQPGRSALQSLINRGLPKAGSALGGGRSRDRRITNLASDQIRNDFVSSP